ncbi:MAG: hypothetical protein AAFO95_06580 [Cyanobacteria bacterium J06600_6]
MSAFDNQKWQPTNRPFNSSLSGQAPLPLNSYQGNSYNAMSESVSTVVNFLDRKFSRTQVHLLEAPCYYYMGNKSKLEITVFSNPQIAKIDVRMITLKSYDREPSYECSYDLKGISVPMFIRSIEDLMSRMD